MYEIVKSLNYIIKFLTCMIFIKIFDLICDTRLLIEF